MEPKEKLRRIPHLPVLAGLMIVIPVLVVAGCTGNDTALDGTRWVLAGYLANGTLVPPLAGTTITLDFSRDTTLTGSAGCNHYFADYNLQGTAITVGPAGSTEMYCMGPGVMEQESAYLALISRAARVATDHATLTLTDSAGTTILTFTREVPPAQQPLVGTNWTLDSIYSGDAVSSVISGTTITAVFDAEGKISGSAGCNQYFGSYTATGTSLSIGSVGSTKMHCPGDGIMLQEMQYLAALGKTAGFSIAGSRLSLADANGTTLLSFTGDLKGSSG